MANNSHLLAPHSLRRFLCRILILAAGTGFPAIHGNEWTLADAKGVRGAIILPPQASPELVWVAHDLQRILKKVTKHELPIRSAPAPDGTVNIYLGNHPSLKPYGLPPSIQQLGEDGYMVKNLPDGVSLCGVRDLATGYAVNDFLEHEVGCRWFLPHPLGTAIPEHPALTVSVKDRTERPGYRFRSLGGLGEWGYRNRLSEHVRLGERTYAKVWGTAHTFYKLLPPEKFFKEHPEYFAEIGGSRRGPSKRRSHGPQICTSNPGAIQETIRSVRKLFAEDPGLYAVTLGPNDGLLFCECKACQAQDEPGRPWRGAAQRSQWRGILSRRLMLFYNAVARGLKRTHPDKILKVMVYSWYQTPPTDKSLRFENNILVMLTHSGNPSPYESVYPSCYNHSVFDAKCRPNRERFLPALEGWAARAKSFGIYEYYYKASMCDILFPIVHTIRQDIPGYRKAGADYFYSQASGRNGGAIGLNYYVAARLLWNPQLDMDALLQDFYDRFYGPAASPMQDYYELLEKTWADSGEDVLGWPVVPSRFMTGRVFEQLHQLLARANGAAASSVAVRARIRLQEVSLEYTQAMIDLVRRAQKLRRGAKLAYWRLPEESAKIRENANLLQRIESVKKFHQAHENDFCLGTLRNNYTRRLLSPAIFGILGDFVASREPLQRPDWARARGMPPASPPAQCELWIYGNDFDRDDQHAEHLLNIYGKGPVPVVTSPFPLPGQAGNRRTRVSSISPFPWKGLPADRITCELADTPGTSWTGSTLFAVYFMPAGSGKKWNPDRELATPEGRERVRKASFAFIELPRKGAHVGDSGAWKVTVNLR